MNINKKDTPVGTTLLVTSKEDQSVIHELIIEDWSDNDLCFRLTGTQWIIVSQWLENVLLIDYKLPKPLKPDVKDIEKMIKRLKEKEWDRYPYEPYNPWISNPPYKLGDWNGAPSIINPSITCQWNSAAWNPNFAKNFTN